jgi:cytochrome-b5 reductase
LTLSPSPSAPPPPFSRDHVQSVEIKHPQVQIARHYTPLPPLSSDDSSIRLLVKREPTGEMSRYLFSLPTGSTIELRGPHEEYALPSAGTPTKLLFLAGGTGIAPALQAAYKLLENSEDAEARILWAVRHRGEAEGAAAEEVARLEQRYPGRLQVGFFPDPEGGMKVGTVREGVHRWGADRVVVCGPDGFVAYWAGPRGPWIGGREQQGELGGVLKRVVEGRDVDVWKMS